MIRKISFLNLLYIYFGTAPFIAGELSLIFGISALVVADINTENLVFGVLLSLMRLYFTYRKISVLIRAVKTIKYGAITNTTLAWVIDSNYRHNQRIVKTYVFNYYVDNKKFTYDYNSAYKRHLKTGDQMAIFYLPSNPAYSFIPELYNTNIK